MGSEGEEDQHSPLMANFSDTDAEQPFKRTGTLSLSLSKHPTFGSHITFCVLLLTLGIVGVRKRYNEVIEPNKIQRLSSKLLHLDCVFWREMEGELQKKNFTF